VKIIKFVAKNLHGYLNFNINFNKDLTFLTGINGSGKTSIIKGVSSLIFPSIINLAHIDYELIQVELNFNGENVKISSKKKKDKIILSCSGINNTKNNEVEINIFPTGDFPESYRYREKEEDFYRNEMIKISDNPIIKYIEKLPTPLILGIERRGSEFFQFREKVPLYFNRKYRGFSESNVHLDTSEAVRLAEEKFRNVQVKLDDITEDLKKHLIDKALEYTEKEKKIDIKKLKSLAKSQDLKKVVSVIVKLGFDEEEIRKKLTIFFNKINEIADYLPEKPDFKKIADSKDNKLIDSYLELILNGPQFYRLIDIVEYIDIYSKKYEKINEPIKRYIKTVNHFFKDSNKEILFSETGSLVVKIKNEKFCSPNSLSSGEIQIIIIMTHLAFNESIQEANIFIIDEPELSLHIRWQEIFVKTIRMLNPELQLIIATHSPSILLNDTEHCISLNKVVKND
jgi:predicted ATPase